MLRDRAGPAQHTRAGKQSEHRRCAARTRLPGVADFPPHAGPNNIAIS